MCKVCNVQQSYTVRLSYPRSKLLIKLIKLRWSWGSHTSDCNLRDVTPCSLVEVEQRYVGRVAKKACHVRTARYLLGLLTDSEEGSSTFL
jgi:hypothetical protein